MMNLEDLLLFFSIAFIATITPGPAIMLVSTNTLLYGVAKSIFTILGNITGLFSMSLLAVLGVSTVILYSANVFFVVKVVGAMYLIYLGVRLWRYGFRPPGKVKLSGEMTNIQPQRSRLYFQGLAISLSNPKAIAFTTALFPQFIDSGAPLLPQFFVLVSIFMLLSFLCLLGYALLATNAKRRTNSPGVQKIVGKMFGSAFVGSGVALAFATQK